MNYSSFFKLIVSISFCSMLFSCSHARKDTFPDSEIKAGMAKVSGKITGFTPEKCDLSPEVAIEAMHLVVGEVIEVIGQLNPDGSFELEVPVDCQAFAGLRVGDFYGIIGLTPNEETHLEITWTETGVSDILITDKLGLTGSDVLNYISVFEEMDNYRGSLGPLDYRLSPNSFAQNYVERIESVHLIKNNPALSEKAKELFIVQYKYERLLTVLMDYKETISILHWSDLRMQGKENELNDFVPEEPQKSYYAFLQHFDMNNPINLQVPIYIQVLQSILENEILQIPLIGDTPLDQWMKEVKAIMTELVGFDKGLFYDMLAANSYARQFNNELRPLSDKQEENIKNYFKGNKKEIAKILLQKNDEIIKLAAQKEPVVVNETPTVPKEKLMEAIVSKYNGKVVVVDFWATWCGPCLEAMKQYRTVKGELKGKDVVFVYLTNGSSPQKLWEEKIKGIGGEHYYLDKEEWYHLMDTFKFEGIPSYVIFDTQGEVRYQFTAYPGNEEMRAMIEELLL